MTYHASLGLGRTFGLVVCVALAGASSTSLYASTIQRLAPAGSLGRIEFKHMKANDSGDFVAVSNMRVFVGNFGGGVTELPLNNDRLSFSLDARVTVRPNPSNTDPIDSVDVEAELYNSRLAINSAGDFVVASNTLIWLGNVRERTIKVAADAGQYTQFQSVAINDAGQFVAISDEQIYAGDVVRGSATQLLAEAVGNFGIFDVLDSLTRRVEVTAGEQRLTLNSNGQFVAITGSAVYGGRVADAVATKIYEERYVGFRHVSLTEAGAFLVVAEQDVFAGTL